MITEETIAVLDDIEALSEKILDSRMYHEFQVAQQALEHDVEAQASYRDFTEMKAKYDEVMRFGKYHPEYQQIMLETRRRKRAYEMLPVVMTYKQKEVALQNLVDQVISTLAYAVSDHVKIEMGNPFFNTGGNGGCQSGGSCKCTV